MHKVSQHMQNTIAQHHQRREKVTWNHQFHCARSSKTFPRLRRSMPETVAQASQLFSAKEAPFTRKNTMFRWIPNIPIASIFRENEAFVRGFLRIPRSWRCENEAVVRGFLQIRLYSTLVHSTQLYATQLNSTLLNSTLLCSTLLCSTPLCSTLLNSSLPNSSQLYSALLCSTLLNSTQLYSTQLYS